MRNLMVFLFLLSFGTSAHAETLAERIEKIPGGTIDLCRGLAFTLFSQAAAGAPLEVLQGEVDHQLSLNSIYLNLNEEDRTYIKRTMISGAFYDIGKTKVWGLNLHGTSDRFQKNSCSGEELLKWWE